MVYMSEQNGVPEKGIPEDTDLIRHVGTAFRQLSM